MSCKSLIKPCLDAVGTEMVNIGVGIGDKRQTFSIHKALLQSNTKHFNTMLASEAGQKGYMFVNDEDPAIFKLFFDWLYTGHLPKPPTKYSIKNMPCKAEFKRLEDDLRQRFDVQERKLVEVYVLGEKWGINNLMNCAIDTIQDGFLEFGAVFGPGLLSYIFEHTRSGSQLRNLCIGANLLHTDRGCCQLRSELQMTAYLSPEFFTEMIRWISRNFAMFSRRYNEGFDNQIPTEGFSILNRKKLCPCHFHIHAPGQAHKGHTKCAIPFNKCGHEDEKKDTVEMPNLMETFLSMSMGEREMH